jgi:hypothetical protein
MDVMQPQFADEEPINPFDFWAGANFKLKIRNVEGYRNYDKSEFDKPSAHHGGDDARLKEIYDNLPSLSELIDPKNFKSYAELKTKFNAVIGETEASNSYTTAERVSLDETASDPSVRTASEHEIESNFGEVEASGANTLSYFAQLAKG